MPAFTVGMAGLAANADAALSGVAIDDTVPVYVDDVTGLDNLMNTLPGRVYRNNVAAFAKFSPLFGVPTGVMGEENACCGTFLYEIKALIDLGARTFAPRSTPTGFNAEFADWLAGTGRKTVLIGGISIDNCTLHTSLDLLRNGYRVFVVIDASGANSKLSEDVAEMRLVAAGAVPVGWLTALTELGKDFAGPFGKGMLQIIQGHWPASTIGPVHDTTPDGHGLQLPL